MVSNTQRYTRRQAQALYEAEVATIRASNEHPQAVGMALNEARRWLDQALTSALPEPQPPATLGERLKHNIAEAERLRLSKEEQANRQARERREQHIREVSLAFDKLKQQVTASIEQGNIPRPIQLPSVLDNNTKSWETPITSADHSDHVQWVSEMRGWAHEQGLLMEVVYEHDGGGMRSWWSLKVTPA